MRTIVKGFVAWTLGLAVLFGVAGLAVPPASAAKRTGGTGKTATQCRADRDRCKKGCDQLIDIGDTIKNCKSRCDVDFQFCMPARSPGAAVGGTTPPLTQGEPPAGSGGVKTPIAPGKLPVAPGLKQP